MSRLPENITDLMRSDAYNNSNNPDHVTVATQVSDYFNGRYGGSRMDATGRNVAIRKVWVWHASADEVTCDACAELSEQTYESRDEVPTHPHHPNCRCWIDEIEVDDNDTLVPNLIRTEIVRTTMGHEGGYEDDPRLIDQPTNAGITQPTLNRYNQDHPEFNFPTRVRDLTGEQAEQIYNEDYYEERRIGEIENGRIAGAIYDMGVMSNFTNVGRMVQQTMNETLGTNLRADGVIGTGTIDALNNIPQNQVENFMDSLRENRIEYLRGLDDWRQYGNGWTRRTNSY